MHFNPLNGDYARETRRGEKIEHHVRLSDDQYFYYNFAERNMACFSLGLQKMSCFKNQHQEKAKGRDLVVQSADGGEDILDAASASTAKHLVVMVNGLVGSAEDWTFAADQFVKKFPDKVIVHRSKSNHSRLTFDGVDKMGERLAKEVKLVIERRHGLQKVSFIAHSLGGLIARYAVGKLYVPLLNEKPPTVNGNCSENNVSLQPQNKHQGSTIAGLEPMNFITFATPHLGSKGNKQLPFLCGFPFLEKRASQTAHWIVGRTGRHLFLTDNDDGLPPLLLRMVDDFDDLHFISALRAFKRRVAYANASFDYMVGWRTSSIRRQDELPKINRHIKNETYPHIVNSEVEKVENHSPKASSAMEGQTVDVEEKMIRGLTQVPWERVDVSFHRSRQRYIAHNAIQVKRYWMKSGGADVVYHMIDNFLV
ncbi:putative lipase C4A8.10 isoform X2 [Nymphaea colorata]|uniref:putative lipase C4A8.10 isoform X2 n=1 Tax=Nymphaea colorata TaxID=210225 RepID=UPI00129E9C8F|nr:putative lipase C4A8.10 isoform X2 [Nymphaea colorata]